MQALRARLGFCLQLQSPHQGPCANWVSPSSSHAAGSWPSHGAYIPAISCRQPAYGAEPCVSAVGRLILAVAYVCRRNTQADILCLMSWPPLALSGACVCLVSMSGGVLCLHHAVCKAAEEFRSHCCGHCHSAGEVTGAYSYAQIGTSVSLPLHMEQSLCL